MMEFFFGAAFGMLAYMAIVFAGFGMKWDFIACTFFASLILGLELVFKWLV